MTQPAEALRLPRDGVVIVGAGLAGLMLALALAPRPAVVLSPVRLGEGCASAWAQGGIAAAFGPEDSPALHAEDTIAAGAGLVDPVVARLLAEAAPDAVRALAELGAPFDRTAEGAFALGLEAAHARHRIAHVRGDQAGQAIMAAVIAAARAAEHVTILEGLSAQALIGDGAGGIAGVLARNADGKLVSLFSGDVALATGGAGGLWPVTTNPVSARGEGLAMAARAGALIADPEFMQFHPTAIDLGLDPAPLASESLRGAGAVLIDHSGARFMLEAHPMAELAPRDIVARAIHRAIAAGRGAFLDARTAVGARFPHDFPTVFAACMAAGIDPREAPIPVAPAAHYHMGGIATDLWGKTTLAGLWAMGECASTGAHGANRLASNSLSEAVVFAQRAARRLREEVRPPPANANAPPCPPALPGEALRRLRTRMGADLGVERSAQGCARARAEIASLIDEHGDANALIAAALIAEAAARRTESRGGHFRSDHPSPAPDAQRSFLTRDDLPQRVEAACAAP